MAKLNKKNEIEEIGNTGIIIDKSIKEYLENQTLEDMRIIIDKSIKEYLENQTLEDMRIVIDESFYKYLENEINYHELIKFAKKALNHINGVSINE
jgi:predicted PilT family ATPase